MSLLDQTRFDVLQTTLQVVSDLHMIPTQRLVRGSQFPLTLIVHSPSGDKPIDIFVDRIPQGEVARVYTTVDQAQLVRTTATIDPDGERFDVEIILDRVRNPANARPAIRVSREMFRILRETQPQFEKETIDKLLEDLGMQ